MFGNIELDKGLFSSIILTTELQKDNFEKQEHLLNKGKAIVVISENGLDAGSAGVQLQKLGIKEVYLLRNGLISWQEESLPLVK